MVAGGVYDLAVIGGGVNGCGIARDAQGRGLRVFLAEMGDLAGGTSSASTKLIHGGLRYLEHREFRLVREALVEREVLLRAAPHIIRPLRFILPHHKGLRPWPVIRLGLFLYDHLGGRRVLPGTTTLDLRRDVAGRVLKPEFRRAFEYSDCWVEDARLVILNARDAADRGATVTTRTRFVSAVRSGDVWRITLEDTRDGRHAEITARALVNAAGPWVATVAGTIADTGAPASIRLVKGSHIIVDRLFDHDRAYIFQNADKRVCFAIPYEHDFTLIGTTDVDYRGDPARVAIDDDEIAYLLAALGKYFARPVTRAMIRGSYAGVRPLYHDGASAAQEATRDYVLKLDAPTGQAPLLSVFGGKITTYRRLAEHALSVLGPGLPAMGPAWTRDAVLPGGDVPAAGLTAWTADVARRHPGLPSGLVGRLCRAYGTRAVALLDGATAMTDLGRVLGADLTAREVDYLIDWEWAMTADDILWRRTKLGLRFGAAERAQLEDYLARRG
ncbi:MAG: glycerol-3-phosphate dehydrogenase [Alphaproteobacteria bacterium]